MKSKQAAPPNPVGAPRFLVAKHRRRVGEQRRSTKVRNAGKDQPRKSAKCAKKSSFDDVAYQVPGRLSSITLATQSAPHPNPIRNNLLSSALEDQFLAMFWRSAGNS